MLQQTKLSKEETIKLFGQYCILKCKGFSQNGISDKHKANILLQCKYNFKSFREIQVFLCKARRVGFISVSLLTPCIAILERFLQQDAFFDPAMEDSRYIDYFFSLTKRLKNTTINQYITCLNLFLRFLNDKGHKASNLRNIRMNFTKEKKLPSFLNEFHYKAFLKEVQLMRETSIQKLRQKLIILLVYYTGTRTREIRNITLMDMKQDNEQYIFKIKGKCSQERFVSVKKIFIGEILEKFLERKLQLKMTSPYLFQLKNIAQAPIISISLKSILAKLNCLQTRGNRLHLLRHSFASFIYRESRDILLTQKALGHSNIANTQIYIHMNTDVYDKVSSFF